MAPWKLPLAVIAIAVPIIFSFYLGGPGLGLAVGALAVAVLIVVAVRMRPREAIGGAASGAGARHLLVVLGGPLEDQVAIDAIVAAVGGEESARTLLLSPTSLGFLDRWASDLEGARREAQRRLVLSIASLAKAGVAAEGRVGDEDLVQAVEDQLGSFPADEVILLAAEGEDPAVEAAARELRARLRPRFRRLGIRR